MLKITELKISINQSLDLLDALAEKLQIQKQDILSHTILKRSLDARKKQDISYVYQVAFSLKDESKILRRKLKYITPYEEKKLDHTYFNQTYDTSKKIAVIGFGPAGMFSSLMLSMAGIKVTIFERGESVDERMKTIENFEQNRVLNTNSNIQFGEGGAGTYSDGKLTSRSMDERGRWMFEELVEAGAPNEILYVHNPHIGTDILVDVVRNIRKKIISYGSEIKFNTVVKQISPQNEGYILSTDQEDLYFDKIILAIGHSSRDTFEMLYENKIELIQKPFAVGFRIEHLQQTINKAQYGESFQHKLLEPAEYKLVNQIDNKAVYTFCMCPGGYVVPASSEEGLLCVNGMSKYKRDNMNANSAILVTVDQNDFKEDTPLAGMHFQREIERKAFLLGGSNYNAPVQLLGDFVQNKISKEFKSVKPSYEIGTTFANLRSIYSEPINKRIIQSLKVFGNKVKGFDQLDSVLTGVETRSSSPIRIVRDKENMQSVSHKNLYPIGEGSGYAGGIVSSGMDGIKASEIILNELKLK